MTKQLYYGALACLLVVSSCSVKVEEIPQSQVKEFSILASAEAGPDTKTVIDDNTLDITWKQGDAINVFFGTTSSKFVTSESGAVAQFKGSIDVVTGGGEGLTDETSLWGVYPYKPNNKCEGSKVILSLPAVQEAAENSFANGLFPQIARSQNFYMSFYNLCGCFRFSVSNPDIKYVTLSGNNDELIAGRAKVSKEAEPMVDEILSGEKRLVMYAPDGGTFKTGVNYYLVLFPTTFSKGLTLTYYKEDTYASYVYSKPYTLGRGVISRFANRDSGLTFVSNPLNDWEEGERVEGEI